MGKLITVLEKALRRLVQNEMLGGMLLLVMTIFITCGVALVFLQVAYAICPYLGIGVAVLLSWSCIAARSLHQESRLVADALVRGELATARRYLSNIVGRDTAELDEAEVWCATVETVAENSCDGVIAPLFYLMLGGPLLALVYKAVNTLDSMVGYRNERYLRFGWASARFDDLANFIPARLTGVLMVAAAPLFRFPPRDAWRIMRRDGRKHSSPNSGIPEAAAAGALGVRLGGASFYSGTKVEKPTIGDPLHPLAPVAWEGAIRLMYGAEGVLVAAWLVITRVLNLQGWTG